MNEKGYIPCEEEESVIKDEINVFLSLYMAR
jgi:hypothetical protein